MGTAWTADLKVTGELDVDLRSNIAAEARAKIVYERLINFCDDSGTKEVLYRQYSPHAWNRRPVLQRLNGNGRPWGDLCRRTMEDGGWHYGREIASTEGVSSSATPKAAKTTSDEQKGLDSMSSSLAQG